MTHQPIPHACHADQAAGEPALPDCVLDYGAPAECVHAEGLVAREACPMWRPVEGESVRGCLVWAGDMIAALASDGRAAAPALTDADCRFFGEWGMGTIRSDGMINCATCRSAHWPSQLCIPDRRDELTYLARVMADQASAPPPSRITALESAITTIFERLGEMEARLAGVERAVRVSPPPESETPATGALVPGAWYALRLAAEREWIPAQRRPGHWLVHCVHFDAVAEVGPRLWMPGERG